ncbi:MAG TPA: hypothetical protein VG186_10365 [Solirubrobacteraceae bacterium]|nr:hypothetical protein [Solirubrobacteraceae bacterium]
MGSSSRFRILAAAIMCGAAITLVGAGVGDAASTPALTGHASSVSGTSAQLNGTIDPGGLDTFWAFQYGTSTAYGQTTSPVPLNGTSKMAVSTVIRGLQAGTTYHFRLIAVQGAAGTSGESTGFVADDVTFTTSGSPSITTSSQNGKKHAKASLRSRTLHVRGRATLIPWGCSGSAGAVCKITMSLSAKGKSGSVSCGTGTFSASTGKRRSVRVALKTKCLALVSAARHHRLGATLKATSRAGSGSLKTKVTLVG